MCTESEDFIRSQHKRPAAPRLHDCIWILKKEGVPSPPLPHLLTNLADSSWTVDAGTLALCPRRVHQGGRRLSVGLRVSTFHAPDDRGSTARAGVHPGHGVQLSLPVHKTPGHRHHDGRNVGRH